MANLPVTGYIENASRTEGEMKTALEAVRDKISQQIGTDTPASVTISGGTITPATRDTGGVFIVDTESAASTDDLNTITQTNVEDGTHIYLYPANASREVVIKDSVGGSGQILTLDGNDYTLDDLDKWILLRRDGTDWKEVARYQLPVADPVAQVYTSSTTWNKPDGLKYVIVEVVGGGGGAGGAGATSSGQSSSGGGGGGGGYSRALILAASLGSSETVTVGAGGAGNSGAAGSTGGTSSFGSHATATGGTGGGGGGVTATFSTANGGAGGIGSGGDINTAGDSGGYGLMMADSDVVSTPRGTGGNGGGSALGGGGQSVSATTSPANGNDGKVYGGGGGGSGNGEGDSARAGGDGADGVVIVKEFF